MVSIAKNLPKTMVKMLLKAQKYMNVEDALVVIEGMEKPKKKRKEKEGEKKNRQIIRILKGTKGRPA